MLLSVIIPAYNVEDYIAQALQSVLSAPTGGDASYEIIVVDDGSTDATAEIVGGISHAHANVRYIAQRHAGVSHARNAALRAAHGQYVTFLDGDDILDSNGLSALLRFLQRGPEADMIIPNMRTVGIDGCDYDWRPHFAPGIIYDSAALVRSPYYRHSACGIAYRRDVVADVMFDESLSVSEDAIWVTSLLARGLTATFVDTCFYVRQPRPGSASRTFDTSRLAADWAAMRACSDLTAHSDTCLAKHAFSRLLFDLAHNMILHAINARVSTRALLSQYPLHQVLATPLTLKHRLMRFSPTLYASLLRAKSLLLAR